MTDTTTTASAVPQPSDPNNLPTVTELMSELAAAGYLSPATAPATNPALPSAPKIPVWVWALGGAALLLLILD